MKEVGQVGTSPVHVRWEEAQVDRVLHQAGHVPLHQVDDGHRHRLGVLHIGENIANVLYNVHCAMQY